MAKVSIFGVLTNIQMLLFTAIRGKHVGTDQYGNRYYRGKPRPGQQRDRRWVIYKDVAEATFVPAEWHGWLHYQTDALPAENIRFRKEWQKPHQPNKTGTAEAYLPPGHAAKGAKRPGVSADYTAWQPPQ